MELEPNLTGEVRASLQSAKREVGLRATPRFVFAFSYSPAPADKLAGLVVSGDKRSTCSLALIYDRDVEEELRSGDISVVVDDEGRLRAVIRTLDARRTPFGDVDADFAFQDGEGDRNLESWRGHRRQFFGRVTAELGLAFGENMGVVCERFEAPFPSSPTPGPLQSGDIIATVPPAPDVIDSTSEHNGSASGVPSIGVSLLHPDGPRAGDTSDWPGSTVRDIGLDDLINALKVDLRYRARVRPLMLTLSGDERVIRYRQEVLDDLLNAPGLRLAFEGLLPRLADLRDYRDLQRHEGTPLEVTIWRLRELSDCLLLTQGILDALNAGGTALTSQALLALREQLAGLSMDEAYVAMRRELPRLMAMAPRLGSVTLGVNLDERLQFSEVTVVAVNDRRYKGSSLLGKLIGRSGDPFQGSGPLHDTGPAASGNGLPFFLPIAALIRPTEPPQARPIMEDLNRLLGPVFMPINSALTQFSYVTSELIMHLGPELALLLAAASLVTTVRAAGLPMCRPVILPAEARMGRVEGLFDLTLALRGLEGDTNTVLGQSVITNDLVFDDEGRVLVLTGPNGGGKTTYTRAVGQAQALFQAGLYVPGISAEFSPVDAIYTHFPAEEKPGQDQGRLAEESERLGEIFARATDKSLVLLNESLASTSPGESLYMARDVVRGLRLLGVRAIYNTHLHDLAAGVDEMNADTPGTSVISSLVAGVELSGERPEDAARRTYRIRRGPPLGLSFAREIASRYGISYPKIAERVAARVAEQGLTVTDPASTRD